MNCSPTPWTLIGKRGTAIWSGNEIIANMTGSRAYHSIARANAELMASAPELLEVLEALTAEANQRGASHPLWDKASAAIAKAKGKLK